MEGSTSNLEACAMRLFVVEVDTLSTTGSRT